MSFLEGKTALVTGAARGLGRAFAEALAAQGAGLVLCDQRVEVTELACELRARGGFAHAHIMDVAEPDQVIRVVSATERERGALHVLVNNAGMFVRTDPLDDFEKALTDWEHVVGTNLFGSYLFGRACAPLLVASGGGDIVNVSSDHVRPPPGRPTGGGAKTDVYDASKWALDGLTQAWARALRKHGVRVNALCMGETDTPMLRAALPAASAAEIACWLRPEQVAGVLVELLREGPGGRSGESIGLWPGERAELPRR